MKVLTWSLGEVLVVALGFFLSLMESFVLKSSICITFLKVYRAEVLVKKVPGGFVARWQSWEPPQRETMSR